MGLRVKTYVAPSPIHGLGVFAAESIAKETVVWELDAADDRLVHVPESGTLPDEVARFGFRIDDDYYVVCGDDARYLNHSDDANLLTAPGVVCETAARDIAVGEELTEDYRYCLDWPEWARQHLGLGHERT
jgi:uncharacterized protein